jgi:hypothetical protein
MVYLALSKHLQGRRHLFSTPVIYHESPPLPSCCQLGLSAARLLLALLTPSPALVLVKEKLTADPDSEVATTSLRVSLMCPVGTRRDRKWEGGWVTF